MTAGHTATSQVRRPTVATPARPAQPPRNPSQFGFAASGDDELRLCLSDIPRTRMGEDLHVDGFKPSLLSRLLDLVMPLRR